MPAEFGSVGLLMPSSRSDIRTDERDLRSAAGIREAARVVLVVVLERVEDAVFERGLRDGVRVLLVVVGHGEDLRLRDHPFLVADFVERHEVERAAHHLLALLAVHDLRGTRRALAGIALSVGFASTPRPRTRIVREARGNETKRSARRALALGPPADLRDPDAIRAGAAGDSFYSTRRPDVRRLNRACAAAHGAGGLGRRAAKVCWRSGSDEGLPKTCNSRHEEARLVASFARKLSKRRLKHKMKAKTAGTQAWICSRRHGL